MSRISNYSNLREGYLDNTGPSRVKENWSLINPGYLSSYRNNIFENKFPLEKINECSQSFRNCKVVNLTQVAGCPKDYDIGPYLTTGQCYRSSCQYFDRNCILPNNNCVWNIITDNNIKYAELIKTHSGTGICNLPPIKTGFRLSDYVWKFDPTQTIGSNTKDLNFNNIDTIPSKTFYDNGYVFTSKEQHPTNYTKIPIDDNLIYKDGKFSYPENPATVTAKISQYAAVDYGNTVSPTTAPTTTVRPTTTTAPTTTANPCKYIDTSNGRCVSVQDSSGNTACNNSYRISQCQKYGMCDNNANCVPKK